MYGIKKNCIFLTAFASVQHFIISRKLLHSQYAIRIPILAYDYGEKCTFDLLWSVQHILYCIFVYIFFFIFVIHFPLARVGFFHSILWIRFMRQKSKRFKSLTSVRMWQQYSGTYLKCALKKHWTLNKSLVFFFWIVNAHTR